MMSGSAELQSQASTSDTREIAGFKSRAPAPTILYVCRESRSIAQKSYTKAFGSADVPAETWIDFEKGILYLSFDFRLTALEDRHRYVRLRFHTLQHRTKAALRALLQKN